MYTLEIEVEMGDVRMYGKERATTITIKRGSINSK